MQIGLCFDPDLITATPLEGLSHKTLFVETGKRVKDVAVELNTQTRSPEHANGDVCEAPPRWMLAALAHLLSR